MFEYEIVLRIKDFISDIGIPIKESAILVETIMPGIQIDNGILVFDKEKLLYPGDLLHMAGHIAVKPSSERNVSSLDCKMDPAEEMMTIAWTYAAIINLNISPEVVFHPNCYKGQSAQIISGFQNGFYLGLPMLQWVNMAADHIQATLLGIEPFPKMIKWVRD